MRKWSKKNYKKVDAWKKRQRAANPEKTKEMYRRNAAKYKAKNREKVKAHSILRTAVLYGKMIKPVNCLYCGVFSNRLEGHHADYSKPLEVIWLCHACHTILHKGTILLP